ncbi:MAG: hypothetical protein B6U97_03495 [Candidatus Altiarchaeales archaeon ex4484_96]|nr:MAG: hypothetical protein B6U97_03495 [Candidatus Altiarchaeales archaeon ex4484_96]
MEIEAIVNLRVEKDGKILEERTFYSESFLRNFIAWLRACFRNRHGSPTTDEAITDVSGASDTIFHAGSANAWDIGACNGLAGEDDIGIVVGTGTASVSPNDYDLASKITHGTGAGQLLYGDTDFQAEVEVEGNYSKFWMSRLFTNNSGDTININEIGIYMVVKNSAGTQKTMLICRDVLASSVSVPDGAALTVRYTIKASA